MKLSLVFPVYDERKTVLMRAQDLFSFWSRFPVEVEVIFVTDPAPHFSPAGLEDELATMSRGSRITFQVLLNEKRIGRGPSVLRGLQAATGEVIGAHSLDLSIPLAESFSALQEFVMNRDQSFLLIGNRRGPKKKRKIAKRGLRAFFEAVEHDKAARLGVHDPTCPFWMLKKKDFDRLEIRKLRSWFYTPQVIHAARLAKLPIRELEVQCLDHPQSHFRFWESVFG